MATMQMPQRIAYMDIDKGILILFLCFCHYPHAVNFCWLGQQDSWRTRLLALYFCCIFYAGILFY